MKKLFALVVFMFVAVSINAQDYNLYIQTSNTETGYALSDLQKLTFIDGKINITKKDGSVAQTVTLTDINRMYFSTTPVGIQTVKNETKNDNDNAPAFNLQGIRVNESFKGIVIKNGKKTFQN